MTGRNFGYACLLLAALACAAASAGEEGLPEMISPDEIRPGMKGIAKTVFSGTRVEDFEIEVVDVVRNFYFDRDVILIRSEDERLVRYGIAGGMSGSPVFIDGKLAGAIALTWMFAKEPIAGVTPIGEMLPMLELPPGEGPGAPAQLALADEAEKRAVHRLRARFLREYYDRMGTTGPLPWYGRETKPQQRKANPPAASFKTPVWVRGMDNAALAILGQGLGDMSLVPLGGAQGGEGSPAVELVPGSVVGLRLAEGDVDITAIGTVTARIGDRILAFGHGLFSEGEVDFPMVTGQVHTIVPSMLASFKVGTALETVGRFTADTGTGIAGRLGEEASMIPVKFTYLGEQEEDESGDADAAARAAGAGRLFEYRVVRHPQLAAQLVPVIAFALVSRGGRLPDENTIRYSVRIELAGHDAIEIEDCAWGPDATWALFWDLLATISDLFTNPFEKVEITGVEVSLSWRRGNKQANIKEIRVLQAEVRPGDDLEIEVTLVPFREKAFKRMITLHVPENTPAGPRTLMVGDAETAFQMRTMENVRRAVPESVDEFVALVSEPRRRRRIGAWLARDEVGVAFEEGELPNLPGSVLGIISQSSRTGISPLLGNSTAAVDTQYIVTGRQTLTITIKDANEPKEEK